MTPVSLGRARRKSENGDRCETGERQRIFSSAWTRFARYVSAYSQCQDRTATHIGCSAQAQHNSVAQLAGLVAIDSICEDKLCKTSKFAGAVCYLQTYELRNTSMLRLRRVAGLCSSNISDPANRLRKTRKKKFSAVPLFRSGHMSAICARLRNKRKWELRG